MQGPMINDAAVHKIESFVQDAVSKGAKVLIGGKKHSLGMTFYEATVIADVKSEMLLSRKYLGQLYLLNLRPTKNLSAWPMTAMQVFGCLHPYIKHPTLTLLGSSQIWTSWS